MPSLVGAINLFRHIIDHPNNRGQATSALFRALLWQWHKRVAGTPIVVPVGRLQFKVVRDSQFSSLVVYNRLPDWDEMNFLLRVLRSGDCFLDVGANVGFYTVLAASVITDGKIVAIEANPRNVAVLQDQIELNGLSNVKIIEVAVGSKEGVLHFDNSERETGSVQFEKQISSKILDVPCSRLDKILDGEFLDRCSLAKIDIEGFEPEALSGASGFLESGKVGAWIFELSDKALEKYGSSSKELLAVFIKYGYSIYYWNELAAELVYVDINHKLDRQNYIAIRDVTFFRNRLSPALTG